MTVMVGQRIEGLADEFSARLVAAADGERRRLERDLHDGAQQRLVSLSMRLQLVAMRLDRESEEARLLAGAQEELASSLRELRELARGLHPAVLSERGLASALESLIARATLPVELDVDLDGRPAAPVEVAAYYLVSEALTNVAKHAYAQSASVRVEERATSSSWRCPTTGWAGPTRRAARGSAAWRIGSARCAAGCMSRARSGSGRSCAPRSRSRPDRPVALYA
jgi:signal transduction histidine kinase